MAGSSLGVVKTAVIPLLVAAAIYIFISFVLLPLYRRYRADIARYSQYAPLTSTLQNTTSIFGDYIPEAFRPRSIKEKLGDLLMKWFLPSMWAARNRAANERRGSAASEDGGLFDEESGERMVGFDMDSNRGNSRHGRNGRSLGIRDAGETDAINASIRRTVPDEPSTRRLSRELEQGFVDSDSDQSEDEATIGRRRASMTIGR